MNLSRTVFFNRLGELRNRSFENQRYRASGLNLVVATIVLWHTVYLVRSTEALREHGQEGTTSCCNTRRRWAGSIST